MTAGRQRLSVNTELEQEETMSLAMNVEQHNAEIVDQFTRQAEPFSRRHAHTHEALLELMAECAGVRAGDSLLDVACGPGIVSCFYAKRVARVTGLDMVPAMLERAQRFQAESKVENVTWKLGESNSLPFAENTFDCAVTRFSFHHFLEPATALREMTRVCKPGGTVLVADVAPSAETQASFNHWEILRDPSHTRALTQAEFESMGKATGLELLRKTNYTMEMDLEGLLSSSFPRPGDADRIRALFEEDIQTGQDRLGVAARREDGAIYLTYPVAVLAWQKPI
jgi:ubiquinone/menaquinone biosynthesis C-methylase UbiE